MPPCAACRLAIGADGFRHRKSSAAAAHRAEQAALMAESGTADTALSSNAEPATARLLAAGSAEPVPEPTAANPYKVQVLSGS